MRRARALFICLLSGLMAVSASQSAILKATVTSVQGNTIETDAGSEKGIKLGDQGRVYYVVQIEGKEKAIYVAKFKITRLSEKSSVGQVEEKTTELKPGYFVEISSVLEGELEIRSEPSGAMVSVDGKEARKTPLILSRIRPGQHQVRVFHEGYEPYEERVGVSEGERKQIFASLKKVTGNLLVRSEPPGASISIDGKPVGVGPYEGKDLSPGKHKVRVVKEGYEPWEAEQKVEAGKSVEVVSRLKTIEGSLEISSEPSGAGVSLDGKAAGYAPLTLFQIPYGAHLIRVDREGYEPHEEKVQVKDSQKARIHVALKKRVGELRVETEPPEARVYLDGKSAGVSPYEGKDLSPGPVKIRVMKEGYETWERDVKIEPGKRVEVLANLKEKKVVVSPPPPTPPSPPPVAKPVVPKEKEVKPEESRKISKETDLSKMRCDAPIWKTGDKWHYRTPGRGNTWVQEVVEVRKDVYILKTPGFKELLAYDKKKMNVVYTIGRDKAEKKVTDVFRFFDFPFFVGKKWVVRAGKGSSAISNEFEVEGVEDLQTPAGGFMTFRIHLKQTNLSSNKTGLVRYWYSPEVGHSVKRAIDKSGYWAKVPWLADFEIVGYELK